MSRGTPWVVGVVLLLSAGQGAAQAQADPSVPSLPRAGDRGQRDAVGDDLPPGAVARLGTVRFRHGSSISSLALSPDGTTLATAGSDYDHTVVNLWEARTGRLLRTIPRVGDRIAFSPDGKLLAGGDYGSVGLSDPATGKILRQWAGHKHHVLSVAFSPDGKMLASGSMDQTAALWEVPSGTLVHRFTGIARGVSRVAFSPDGKRLLLVGQSGTVRIHDATSFRELRRFETLPTERDYRRFALSADAKTLAVPTADGLVLWNVETGKPLYEKLLPPDPKLSDAEKAVRQVRNDRGVEGLSATMNGVHGMAFSPDGKLLVVAGDYSDREIRFIDVAKNRVVRKAQGSRGSWHLVFFPDGNTIASGGGGGIVQLWDTETARERDPQAGHVVMVRALAFTPDGQTLASAAFQDGVAIWQTATGRLVRRVEVDRTEGAIDPAVLAFAPDGKTLAGASHERDLRLWDPADGRLLVRLKPPQSEVSQTFGPVSVAFAPDGGLLASAAVPVRLWDPAKGRHVRGLAKSKARAVAFRPDGAVLASAGDAITLWDPATGQEKREFGSGTTYSFLQFVEGGQTLLSADERGVLSFWAMPRGKLVRQFNLGYLFRAVAVAPDGLTAVTAGGEHRVRDAKGYLVPSRDPMTVRLWDLLLGKEIRRWDGHTAALYAVAFTSDGRTVASAGSDTAVVLWDATGLGRPGPPARLTPADREQFGLDLAGDDAGRASRATWALVAAGEPGVAFLRQRWFQPKEVPDKVARVLVEALADDTEEVRQRAKRELESFGLRGWATWHRINNGPLPVQVRDRLEESLDRLRPLFVAELRLQRRSVMILEQVGAEAARQGLADLARLAVDPVVAAEVQAALARLGRR